MITAQQLSAAEFLKIEANARLINGMISLFWKPKCVDGLNFISIFNRHRFNVVNLFYLQVNFPDVFPWAHHSFITTYDQYISLPGIAYLNRHFAELIRESIFTYPNDESKLHYFILKNKCANDVISTCTYYDMIR